MLIEIEKHSFTLEGIKPYNNRQGVYALVYGDQIIYIGQSKDLGKRLKEHRQENAFQKTLEKIIKEQGRVNRCKALAMYDFINKHREEIYFIILVETQELDKYEEQYITLYQPKYNYKGVDIPYK